MKKIKLLSPIIAMLLFTAITLSCSEGAWQEEEITPAASLAPDVPLRGGLRSPTVDTTTLRTIYVEWQPYILTPLRDQIRSGFSDDQGEVFLYDYKICDTNSNIEQWRVILRPPKDQTPPPLVIMMDTEDEMKNAAYNNSNFGFQCNF